MQAAGAGAAEAGTMQRGRLQPGRLLSAARATPPLSGALCGFSRISFVTSPNLLRPAAKLHARYAPARPQRLSRPRCSRPTQPRNQGWAVSRCGVMATMVSGTLLDSLRKDAIREVGVRRSSKFSSSEFSCAGAGIDAVQTCSCVRDTLPARGQPKAFAAARGPWDNSTGAQIPHRGASRARHRIREKG